VRWFDSGRGHSSRPTGSTHIYEGYLAGRELWFPASRCVYEGELKRQDLAQLLANA
jgi:hypothetical protein